MEENKSQEKRIGAEVFDGFIALIQRRPRTVLGVLIGFFAGLLYHWLGFWHTLVLIIFVVIGLLVGKYLDERKEVGRILDRLFTSEH